MAIGNPGPDRLDVALLAAAHAHTRPAVLDLARATGVSRATVQARLRRLEESGVITGYTPDLDLAAAGYPVQAFVTLEIAQGRLADVAAELAAVPGVLEAYATTGTGDVWCRVAAGSHQGLQDTLIRLNRSPAVVRSTSVIALSVVVPLRVLPLLADGPRTAAGRAPGYRDGEPRNPA